MVITYPKRVGWRETCPICAHAATLTTRPPFKIYALAQCARCGHVCVAGAQYFGEENARIQEKSFGESFVGRAGPFVTIYNSINARRVMRSLNIRPRSQVLEIGPGDGTLLDAFAKAGHDVVGLDLSPAVARHILSDYGIPVLTQSLESLAASKDKKTFDVIVMRHVLEHFTEPRPALAAAASLLKPRGTLYVAVPNMESWHAGFSGWAGYADYHMQYFNCRSLTRAVTDAGLKVAYVGSYEPISSWPNTLLRTLETAISGNAARDGYTGNPLALKRLALETMRFVAGLSLSPLRWVQGALGRGDELVIVAEASAE